MLRDAVHIVGTIVGIGVGLAALVYMPYCAIRSLGARLRALAHLKRGWLFPLFFLIPYGGILTEAGQKHLIASYKWFGRSVLSAMVAALALLIFALVQPRIEPWCAGSTVEAPRAGCPAPAISR